MMCVGHRGDTWWRCVVLQVDIVRVSSVDFQFVPTFEGENRVDAHYIAMFKGFIHPLNAGNNKTAIKLYLVAAAAQAYLYTSPNDDPLLKVIKVYLVAAAVQAYLYMSPNDDPLFKVIKVYLVAHNVRVNN